MKGTYALVMGILGENNIDIGIGKKRFALAPGKYVYVGSAFGPGGIEARAGRHLTHVGHSKPAEERRLVRHWHIDYLFPAISDIAVVAAQSEDKRECRVVRELKSAGAQAVRGFGSTDCREGCGGHLLLLGEASDSGATAAASEAFRRAGLNPFRMR